MVEKSVNIPGNFYHPPLCHCGHISLQWCIFDILHIQSCFQRSLTTSKATVLQHLSSARPWPQHCRPSPALQHSTPRSEHPFVANDARIDATCSVRAKGCVMLAWINGLWDTSGIDTGHEWSQVQMFWLTFKCKVGKELHNLEIPRVHQLGNLFNISHGPWRLSYIAFGIQVCSSLPQRKKSPHPSEALLVTSNERHSQGQLSQVISREKPRPNTRRHGPYLHAYFKKIYQPSGP